MYNRFKINGNKNIVEPVTSDVIEKLAEESKSIDSQNSIQEDNVEGTLTVYKAYKDSCTYLVQKYNPNLRINIEDDYYIRFKDQSIPQALIAEGYGDGYGITMSDAASFNASTLWTNNLAQTFKNCTSFDELEYFTNVKSIKRDYFGSNNSGSQLSSINLKNIETIEYNGFRLCKNLSSLGDISNLKVVAENVFAYCDLRGEYDFSHITNMSKINISGNPNLTRVILSSSTTELTGFTGCTSLTYIGPLDNITYVAGWRCFENTPNLTMIFNGPNVNDYYGAPFHGSSFSEIILPNLIFISGRNDVFQNCKATHIKISNDNTFIVDGAFHGCSKLTNIELDFTKITSIGVSAFYSSMDLEANVSLAFNNCTTVGGYAFKDCRLKSVSLPSVTTFGTNAFEQSKIQTVLLSTSLTSIDWNNMFVDSKQLASVTGLSNITAINGSSMLRNCTNLTSVDFNPSKLKVIADSVFQSCTSLTFANLLLKPTSIGTYAFAGSGITQIDLSECESIGNNAFDNCKSLVSINKLSNNLTVIPSVFLAGCSNLSLPNNTLEIPASVQSIASDAFTRTSITTLKFLGTTPPEITGSIKYFNPNITQLLVPQSALSTYQSAETWQESRVQNKLVGY